MTDTEKDYGEILEALLKSIARGDEEFQQTCANCAGVSLEVFQDFLDNAEFPVIGKRDRHAC